MAFDTLSDDYSKVSSLAPCLHLSAVLEKCLTCMKLQCRQHPAISNLFLLFGLYKNILVTPHSASFINVSANPMTVTVFLCINTPPVQHHGLQLVFLHCDRYVEFHSQQGHYYKTRIPKFGRDFSYHSPSCDLYFVGSR